MITALNTIRGTISKTITKTVTKTHTDPARLRVGDADLDREQGPGSLQGEHAISSPGAVATQLGMVPSAAECANFQNGWYYDDPVKPTKIIACPTTCDAIKAATDAKIDILVGCETIIAPPK